MRHYGFKGFTEGGAYSWFTININKCVHLLSRLGLHTFFD